MIELVTTPQRSDFTVTYTANGDVLTVKVDDATDTFDFGVLQDGDMAIDFVSTLPVCPILGAECELVEGVKRISVRVIKWYGAGETPDGVNEAEVAA